MQHPSNQNGAAGVSVQFRCAVNGHPTPLIIWKQNGTPLNVIIEQLLRQNELDKYLHSKVGSNFVLEVNNATCEEENANYTCQDENDDGSLESKKAYLSTRGEFRYTCMFWYAIRAWSIVWVVVVHVCVRDLYNILLHVLSAHS